MKAELTTLSITKIELQVSTRRHSGVVKARLVAPCVGDARSSVSLATHGTLAAYEVGDLVAVAKLCRRLALQLLAHELEEHLRIDGVRVIDPHPVSGLSFALDDDPLNEGPL